MAHDLTTTSSQVNDAISLRWYVAVLRERWKFVVAGAVIGLLVASAFLVLTEKSYTARTVVSMNVIGSSPTGPADAASSLIDLSTETQLASSFEVASLASEVLDGRLSAREIRDNVSVSAVADATVLIVNFTAASADDARAGADAVAQGYLDYRSASATQRIDEAITFIEVRAAELRSELDDLAAQLAAEVPGSEGELRAETDRSVLLESLRTLLAQQFELERVDTLAGVIISPAEENYVEVSPSTRMVLASGLLGGMLLGSVGAFISNASSRTVSAQRQVAALLGWRSLGEVPVDKVARSPKLLEVSAVRTVAARLVGELTDSVSSVVVVDAAGDEGPTVLPFVLAASVARSSRPVNVIVAGMSDGAQEQLIESLDLSAVRANQRRPAHRTPLSDRVRVFFAPWDGRSAEFEPMIERARQTQARSSEDITPLVWLVVSHRASTDARLMAMQSADVALLVVRLGMTTRKSVEEFTGAADRFGCRVIGSVTATESRRPSRRSRPDNRDQHADVCESDLTWGPPAPDTLP